MRILNVISCFGHGQGGHFYSCKAIGEAYHTQNYKGDAVDLCTIGWGTSPVLSSSFLKQKFIKLQKNYILGAIFAFFRIVRNGKYDILHAYDEKLAFPFVRIAATLLKKKYILTKCGGPNRKTYPFSSTLIVFSKENLDHLRIQKKFQKTQFHLIPNREIDLRKSSINDLQCRKELGIEDNYLLLRIARIGQNYFDSTKQLIEHFIPLAQQLKTLKLLLIGVIESQNHYYALAKLVFQANKSLGREIILIKTDTKYTLEASKFIDLADAVIATGRGVIEAMAKSKPVFVATNDGNIVLINQKTASALAHCNLSGRLPSSFTGSFQQYTLEVELPKLLGGLKFRENVGTFSHNYYQNHYSLKNAVSTYESVYHGFPESDWVIRQPFDLLYTLYWAKRHASQRQR